MEGEILGERLALGLWEGERLGLIDGDIEGLILGDKEAEGD